jgi:hypothetical protein
MNDRRSIGCPGPLTRRDFVRVGGLSALGLSVFNSSVAAASAAKSCILLWLDGGPSHLETFDPKPEAPSEVRGPLGTIRTALPGVQLSECLPETAKIVDDIAIVRSMTSPLGEHGLANHYLLTGYQPSPALVYPSYGAVVAHERSRPATLPPYIAIPEAGAMAGCGYLNSSCGPFAVGGDPAKPNFQVRDLDFYPEIDRDRLERRRTMVQQLDQLHRRVDASGPTAAAMEQAFRLILSPQAKQAFALDDEPANLRAKYGPRTFGQSCLLARRMIERGVPFVTVHYPGWDTHADLVVRLKEGYAGATVGVGLIPTLDLAFAALIRDLKERGLLNSTLVMAMGEFGRTPKINASKGRDHWPRAFSVVLAGGGIRGGRVFGASDRIGESPTDQPVTPNDLAATIYHLLGVNAAKELHTTDGRPVAINAGGRVIRELL